MTIISNLSTLPNKKSLIFSRREVISKICWHNCTNLTRTKISQGRKSEPCNLKKTSKRKKSESCSWFLLCSRSISCESRYSMKSHFLLLSKFFTCMVTVPYCIDNCHVVLNNNDLNVLKRWMKPRVPPRTRRCCECSERNEEFEKARNRMEFGGIQSRVPILRSCHCSVLVYSLGGWTWPLNSSVFVELSSFRRDESKRI